MSDRRGVLVGGGCALVVAVLVLIAGRDPESAGAAPHRPADDRVVLARVPASSAGAEERRLRAALAAQPADLEAALALARDYIADSRRRGDPRPLGYAQAALAPWWDRDDAPAPVLLLRATIRQSNHDFTGALADLDRVLALAPDDAQAWLTRAVVATLRADYAAARRSCEALRRLASPLVHATCRAGVDAMTGRARAAHDGLARVLSDNPDEAPATRAWALGLLAELADGLGDAVEAEADLRAALAIDPENGWMLGAFADLLLDQGRPAEAVALLAGREDADGLLLRLAIAERAAAAPAAAAHAATLRERYAASRARGDRIHLREEARFALAIDGDAAAAAALASENWTVQRELADARIALEAAVAAGDRDAAAPVLAWMDANHVEHRRLAALREALR